MEKLLVSRHSPDNNIDPKGWSSPVLSVSTVSVLRRVGMNLNVCGTAAGGQEARPECHPTRPTDVGKR